MGERTVDAETSGTGDLSCFAPWPEYLNYRRQLRIGLRLKALSALDVFLNTMAEAGFDDRRAFLAALMSRYRPNYRFRWNKGAEQVINHPIRNRLVIPTLREWAEEEPEEPAAVGWLAVFSDDLEKNDAAIRMGWRETEGLLASLDRHFRVVDYAVHELPEGYLGDLDADLASVRWMEFLAERLAGADGFADPSNAIHELKEQLAFVAAFPSRFKVTRVDNLRHLTPPD